MDIVDQILLLDFGFNPNQAETARQKLRGNDVIEFYMWQHWMQATDEAARSKMTAEYAAWIDGNG